MKNIEQNAASGKAPAPADRKVKVEIGSRKFTVHFVDGTPARITERKMYAPGKPFASWYNAPYWHANHHKSPKRKNSLIARILSAAVEQ